MTRHSYATGPWSGGQRNVHVPARSIITPTGTIIRGRFPSVTARRMVGFEQLLERDALYLCDFAPQVVDIREQPFKLQYTMGNKVRRYTPDYALILKDDSSLIIEVKPARSLAKSEIREKLLYIRDAMRRQGHQFIVLSSDTVRAPHRLDNLKQLHRDLRQPLSTEDILVKQQLSDCFGASTQVAMGLLSQWLRSTVPVLRLLAHGQVSCDLNQLITDDTLITLAKQEADYVFVDSL
ncbi:TnsA endonuclease N-terminal domain-containing protein [Crenobacter cavernae]|uniref:Transposase n=1 Tax=Crenobacter cavernae TaxID=2290923 RepID=A0A345Y2H3_9NEIS|nr:TnsA endonuclease N-terminal domain-containing protein [Crenobacter cavernae]AXK38125.1 transposase [Crenobacter cavernae]